MIEQQYYTRERRGIFRPSEGYDSIAKSRGLNDNFIKKYLHPFCFYDPPRSFDRLTDRSSLRYPESFSCFHVESGEMVIGRTVYKESDFTGLRSTYFTHNLIIPMEEKKIYIRDINRVIFASIFTGSYNIENGMEIPQVDSIGYTQNSKENELEILKQIGLNKEIYKKLLYAAIVSAAGKKNIYINLGVNISEISDYAKIVLKYILNGLPYGIRENTGYITYLRDPENRRYINIMFVEDEGLKANYLKVEKEYVFDLARSRIQNLDLNTEIHPYLGFIFDNIKNLERLQGFFDFISALIYGANEEIKFKPETYDELCILYQLVLGNMSIYEGDRKRIHEYVLKYYGISNQEGKSIINSIYQKLVDYEIDTIKNNGRYLPSVSILKNSSDYYHFEILDSNKKIINLYLIALYYSHKNNNESYIADAFSIASKNRDMNTKLIENLLGSNITWPLFNNYLQNRFAPINSLNALAGEINYWIGVSQKIIGYIYFQNLVKEKIGSILKKSGNVITEGNEVSSYFNNLPGVFSDRVEAGKCGELIKAIAGIVDELVYENIDIESITTEDLMNLKLRVKRNEQRYEILEFLCELVHSEYSPYTMNTNAFLDVFKSDNSSFLRRKIRELFKNSIEYKNFSKIILGFIEEPYLSSYDYDGMLRYISEKGSSLVYDFLLWSFRENVFSNSVNKDRYHDAIRNYFVNYDRDAFKDKQVKKRLYGSHDRELNKLLEEIELELMSPFTRFFIKYRGRIARIAILLVLAAALVFGAIKLLDVIFPINNNTEPTGQSGMTAEQRLKRDIEEEIKKIDSGLLESYNYQIACILENNTTNEQIEIKNIGNNEASASEPELNNTFIFGDYTLRYGLSVNNTGDNEAGDKELYKFKAQLDTAIETGAKDYVGQAPPDDNGNGGGN